MSQDTPSRLRVEALDLKIGYEELDGLLVDLVLSELAEVDDVVEESRVGHAGQAVGLERSLEKLHLLLGDVELERLHGKSLDENKGREQTQTAKRAAIIFETLLAQPRDSNPRKGFLV